MTSVSSEVRCIDCLRFLKAEGGQAPRHWNNAAKRTLAMNLNKVVTPLRCVTHYREFKARNRSKAHERHVTKTYGLEPGEYEATYAIQGGKCYLCQVATGKRKRLAVDHDHATGEPRGLLCGPCNKDVIGRIEASGDGRALAVRILVYLSGDTPYRVMKAGQKE